MASIIAETYDTFWLVWYIIPQLKVDMQVLEDALCNWQKSPYIFMPFRG